MSVGVIVVAAGSGTRLGAGTPKAFVGLADWTVLDHALERVSDAASVGSVVVVVPASHVASAERQAGLVLRERFASPRIDSVVIVAGGSTRQASVAVGLAALPAGVDVVLVHDAARALAPAALFDRVAAQVAASGDAVIPVLPVADTIKRVADGVVTGSPARSELVAAQTPQGFPRAVLERAYAQASRDETDDAALVAAIGVPVRAVDGDELAFKITTAADLERARQLLGPDAAPAARRVGVGVDAHAFAEEGAGPLWLGGVEWATERGLAGHSDGDVVAHAIVDALLGAAGLGDIGSLFGTDDPAAAGAHADWFLPRARDRVLAAGYRVLNVSVEVVGDRPRLAPRRAEVEATLSALVGAPVSVGATTSDGLGLTGEGRGIGAIATALLA